MPATHNTINIHATTRNELDEQLQVAHETLQTIALLTGSHGILITRHQPGQVTASLSDQVPYGLTREQYA